MGPIWGRQDPDGPHVGPMNFAIWAIHWRNSLQCLPPPSAAYMRRWTGVALVQIMAWHRTGDKPLPAPVLIHWTLDLGNKHRWNSYRNTKVFIHKKAFEYAKWLPFCPGGDELNYILAWLRSRHVYMIRKHEIISHLTATMDIKYWDNKHGILQNLNQLVVELRWRWVVTHNLIIY